MSIIDPPPVKTASGYRASNTGPLYEGGGEQGGFDPNDLREAYKIPATGGSTQTVAIVDAFDDPNAESDLAKYRARYGLPECKKENSTKEITHCFRKVNEKGEEGNYPSHKYPRIPGTNTVEDWGLEISLDLDMVSAICPECKLLLVEANENTTLYKAEEEAEKLEEGGKKLATEISNSWAGEEFAGESEFDKYFDYEHKGDHTTIPITAAAGDSGYTVEYPAASKYVISVGGTTLHKKSGSERGWEEEVWDGTGSGCSEYEPSPEWQTGLPCGDEDHRVDNDVAAVANPGSPVSAYDSYEYTEKLGEEEVGTGKLGWTLLGGTSAATPLVAGVEAHASGTVKAAGAEAFYDHVLFDVTSGTNGSGCRGYVCNAGEGYDGPTGWGTPDDPLETTAKYGAITAPADELKPANALLAGYINPEGKETTYHFEYGKTTAYGTNVPTTNASAGSGTVWKGVSQSISGLEWETVYHYRLVAVRGTETKYGQDHAFTTVPWTTQSTPAGGGLLRDVSCASVSACTAVGEKGASAEIWNGTEWKQQTVPVPTGGSALALEAVSCSSSAACAAVGHYKNSSKVEVTLAERWNGAEWQIQSTPNPTGALASELTGISCPSASVCMAVGSYESSSKTTLALAEYWNGVEWILKSPTGATEVGPLASVSCSSSSACMTDRAYGLLSEAPSSAEHWNGTEWQVQKLPTPEYERHAASEVHLYGMSCVASTECTATGSYRVEGYGYFPLVEHWNGTEWTIQSVPMPPGLGDFDNLTAVSCTSALSCTAAGQNNNEEDFAEHWNGAEWRLQTMAEAPGENYLEGISCVEPEREVCTTVGGGGGNIFRGIKGYPLVESETVPVPFAESKEGTSTSETTEILNGAVNPNGAETKYYFEYGTTTAYGSKTTEASAGAGTSKVEESKAISGLKVDTTYHFRIVTSSGKGTSRGLDRAFTTPYWRITSIPNPSKTVDSFLWASSCTVPTACTAVGEYTLNASAYTPMAERWNGSEWVLQSTPNPSGSKTTELYGVSCTSATACMAVGYYENSSGSDVSLTELWNGTEWKIESTAEPAGTLNSLLKGVSCTSSTACTAVGWYENSSGVEVPWAARWNGTAWSVQSVAVPTGAKVTYPYGVSCSSSNTCTMVGYYENSSSVHVLFAENWSGTEWTIRSTPNPMGALSSALKGVSCTSSTTCMAVGNYENSSGSYVSLAEHWNGTEWSIQPTPSPTGSKASPLIGVSCASAEVCTAVGDYESSSGVYWSLAEHWHSTEWSIQSAASGELEGSHLDGVSCASTGSCVAVGRAILAIAEIYD